MCLQSCAGTLSAATNSPVMLFNSPGGLPPGHCCVNIASSVPHTALSPFHNLQFLIMLVDLWREAGIQKLMGVEGSIK